MGRGNMTISARRRARARFRRGSTGCRATRTVWTAILLLSFGMFFELYDLLFSAYIAPTPGQIGLLTPTTPGLFGPTGVAGFIAALFTGLFIGTLVCGFLADRLAGGDLRRSRCSGTRPPT